MSVGALNVNLIDAAMKMLNAQRANLSTLSNRFDSKVASLRICSLISKRKEAKYEIRILLLKQLRWQRHKILQ